MTSHSTAAAGGRTETHFRPEELQDVCSYVLQRLGTPAEAAAVTAESLVESNLVGHDSHGVQRLLQYAAWIAEGQVDPAGRPRLSRSFGATAIVDGGWGLGQPAARLATETARSLAEEHGVSAVVISRCNHIGRLGEYVEQLARAGLIGMAFCNSGPVVAPTGGRRATFGTNPFAWSAPQDGAAPLVLDFSTAAVAEGKVRLSLARGQQLAEGILLDAAGQPTTDPADLYAGGVLLPFGGHKGSGLSLMIEVVGGLLSGMGAAAMPDYGGGNGTVVLALSIAAFTELGGFTAAAGAFGRRVREAPDGALEPGVLLPGQFEHDTRARRLVEGIAVPDSIRREISALVAEPTALGRFAA